MGSVKECIKRSWRFYFCIFLPLTLLPLVFVEDNTTARNPQIKIFVGQALHDVIFPIFQKFKCLYVILIMAVFWMTEAIPLAITSLLPIPLFPVLGIQSSAFVCTNYMKETIMMMIGAISLALATQRSGLNNRIALKMMTLIGTSQRRMLFGIMLTTFTLCGWIVSNTAVTAMIIPIVSGLLDSLEGLQDPGTNKKIRVLYMLATAYSANIGATSLIIGAPSNIVYKDLISEQDIGQNGKYTDVNFVSWMTFAMPIAFINLIVMWGFFCLVYLRKTAKEDNASKNEMKKILKAQLSQLGPLSFAEGSVCVCFILAVLLWFTRDPKVFTGWATSFLPISIGDSSVAIIFLVTMFVIPKDLKNLKWIESMENEPQKYETLLTWDDLQHNFPWSIILLVGGGFAIADGSQKSGLSLWVGELLGGMDQLPKPIFMFIALITVSLMTETMSNAATISLLTPVFLALSKRQGLHPLYISFPAAIACRFAFILPTSSPANALVFSACDMRIRDMVKVGLPLNFICISILYLMTLSWGEFIFTFSQYEYPY